MMSGKEYGFEDDYEGYLDLEDAGTGEGQPKPDIKYKEIKKQNEVL